MNNTLADIYVKLVRKYVKIHITVDAQFPRVPNESIFREAILKLPLNQFSARYPILLHAAILSAVIIKFNPLCEPNAINTRYDSPRLNTPCASWCTEQMISSQNDQFDRSSFEKVLWECYDLGDLSKIIFKLYQFLIQSKK